MALFFGTDVWDAMDALQRQMDRIAEGRNPAGASAASAAQRKAAAEAVDWVPLADLSEDDAAYHAVLELPGVRKENVAVDLREGVLTVRGVKAAAAEGDDKEEPSSSSSEQQQQPQPKKPRLRMLRAERPLGRFARSFSVPSNIDPSAVTATFVDGVLRIRIAKPKRQEPMQIAIH